MKALMHVLFLAALMMPLAACGGEEAETTDGVQNAVEEASEAANEAATSAATGAAEKICCGGACDSPAGFCCNDDGTCGGSHEKLPVAP